jgi:hypothetical protein
MPIDIDGIAVLRAIVLAPKLFPDAAHEINGFARKYVATQLKPATITLERVRDIYRAIGREAFVLVLDYQTDSVSAALVKNLDKVIRNLKTRRRYGAANGLPISQAARPGQRRSRQSPYPKHSKKPKKSTKERNRR